MTNEQAKQEAIKKAYGDKWDFVKGIVDDNGYCEGFYFVRDNAFGMNHQLYHGNLKINAWRPLQLKNIDFNNGWIRIEPDGSNLPPLMPTDTRANNDIYKVCYLNEYVSNHAKTVSDLHYGHYKDGCTHYKPIKEELKPIY